MDADDLEPHHRPKKAYFPVDVTALSIEELAEYIDFLKHEIDRSNGEIEAKKGSISAADQLFKK